MAVLLVTYDLNKPGQDYSDLLKAIKSYTWARLSESSYAIVTDKTPTTISGELKPFLDASDYIYIVNLKRPFWEFGLKEINEWLEKHLPY